ncbi:MAG: hypothetical protein WD227_09280 [Vicinamibacterales bacterium]
MAMLSEDDRNLRDLSDEELALAWDLWFDLAQTTNDDDPPYFHGVFQLVRVPTSSGGWGGASPSAVAPNTDPST